MLILICYDVSTQDPAGARRLRRVSEACKDHGVRVQYSVFECRITPAQWVALRARLLSEIDIGQDSLRFYFLRDSDASKAEHHGQKAPVDPLAPLIV